VQPRLLRGRDRYERRTEAWTDNLHDDAFTHTVRLGDDDRAVEVVVLALPSPSYEIREAGCRVLEGDVAPDVVRGVAALAGTRMVAGFTRRVAEATGGGIDGALVVDAAVEVARLARQTTRLPRERAARAAADAWECWQLDMAGWVDLPDSCFTYSPAGRALFASRAVTTSSHPDLYSPRPGQRRVFVRTKLARLERTAGRLRLFHAMHDNVHGFEVTCEVDVVSATMVGAEHITSRLPYAGICSEPQARLRALVGEKVDDGLRKRLAGLVGGPSGCAQLYDLVADLLKLLAP
jgi:hypothetical protein